MTKTNDDIQRFIVLRASGLSYDKIAQEMDTSKPTLLKWAKEFQRELDEAQFFDDEIVAVCNDLANSGIRVIVAGLDMDFKGNPFGPMPALMATAEYVTKVHAVCTRTGNLANYSYRKTQNDNLVLLGETEEYEPLSRAAFFKAMKSQKENK